MSDEGKLEKTVNTETVAITEQEMQQIDKELSLNDNKLLDKGVELGKEIATTKLSNEQLKKEIEELKRQNDDREQKLKEEQERLELEKQLEAEKLRLQQPIKKNLVAQSSNPTVTAPSEVKAPELSIPQQWELLGRKALSGQMKATSKNTNY